MVLARTMNLVKKGAIATDSIHYGPAEPMNLAASGTIAADSLRYGSTITHYALLKEAVKKCTIISSLPLLSCYFSV